MKKATLTINKHEAEIIRRALVAFRNTGNSYIFGCPADWSQEVDKYYMTMDNYIEHLMKELDKVCDELKKD